ncbi:MAG: hypothetical protein M0Z84_15325 [Gammaproteobacteria bacterium]|nr:hypothetical protein [Gammaproteobacteria bacterium]
MHWNRKSARAVAFLGLSLTAFAVHAAPAVDAHVGTLGYGLGLTFPLENHTLEGRILFNTLDYNHSKTYDSIDYDGNLRLRSAGALLDWYPFHGVFRLSGGLLYNGNKVDLTAVPNAGGTYTINGNTYSATQVGSLTGTMDFNSVSPYLGIGFGNSLHNGRLTLLLDVGAIYQGSPKVSLSATGAAGNPALQADVQQAAATVASDAASYKWWPVIQLGIGYRF